MFFCNLFRHLINGLKNQDSYIKMVSWHSNVLWKLDKQKTLEIVKNVKFKVIFLCQKSILKITFLKRPCLSANRSRYLHLLYTYLYNLLITNWPLTQIVPKIFLGPTVLNPDHFKNAIVRIKQEIKDNFMRSKQQKKNS